ncbi:MAG: exonuclease domain-containing protein [Campylobacterota bacterium]|nr:exonuclease domain-containing protein [Campylobacterota bacterium]
MQTSKDNKMLIFIDIETTGLEASDKICSISVVHDKSYIYELINEGKKIPPKASSIHHITNEDIKEKPAFKESSVYKFLQEHNSPEHTLIAHNIKFDLEKLASHGLVWVGDVIDTLKVTKHLIPECEFFGLQVLRYELKLYKQEQSVRQEYGIKDALVAHNALGDALVMLLLFRYLQDMADEKMMKELSFKNVLLEKFSFGKHSGKYIEEVCFNDRAYVEWLLNTATDLDEDMKYSINYYLQG